MVKMEKGMVATVQLRPSPEKQLVKRENVKREASNFAEASRSKLLASRFHVSRFQFFTPR
jgi:hypothetical protein